MRTSLVNFAIRRLVKPRLAACKTPLDVRKAFASAMPWPRDVNYVAATVGGVEGEWAEPKTAGGAFGTLLYVHGGGYVAMSARTHRAIAGAFARQGMRVFTPNYRLAPEHPFPAGLNDLTQTWRALREAAREPLFVAGDSAGGGLAAALLLKLRDLDEAGPAATCLFSPWTDLEFKGQSLRLNKDRDPMQVESAFRMLAVAYAGGSKPGDPLLSPVNGRFSGVGPMLVFVGDTEILLDDAKRLVARAQADGCFAKLTIFASMPHAWPLLGRILPEGRQAVEEACAFFQASALRSVSPSWSQAAPLTSAA